jgi:alkaline phosphatase D
MQRKVLGTLALNLFCLILTLQAQSSKSDVQLISLMLGHNSFTEASLWVQLNQSADLRLEVLQEDLDFESHKDSMRHYHQKVEGKYVYTTVIKAFNLNHGTRYKARLYATDQLLDDDIKLSTQILWPYRTDPPAYRIALGSCVYVNEPQHDRPGRPYGGEYEIFESLALDTPDVMLWLGDNTYFRPSDWTSESGLYYRWAHTRALPQMQNLLRSAVNYAIWDDHDYGPNDSDRSYPYKDWSLEAFKSFWANPTYGVGNSGGTYSALSWGDVDIFLLDNRWFRSPNNLLMSDSTLLGKEQIDWLIENLVNSRAPFKLVAMGGQLLNTAEVWETYSNLAPAERSYILRRIEEEQIQGVIFLSGDRHHSELSKLELSEDLIVYDLTSSPLSSRAHKPSEEDNELRVGEMISVRNYALMDFSGAFGERVLEISFRDSSGEEIVRHRIEQPGR